jgi:Uma2 family endonuclease
MKAVMANMPEHLLSERKRTGADRWDEMWDGVLHMPAMPNREHQDFKSDLRSWIKWHWARPLGNRVHEEVNLASIGGWPRDYRIPDLLLLTPDRFHIDKNEYFEGAPTAVVEIRSPFDESYEKLPFYAGLGVPEVWIIDRDSRTPEIHALRAKSYRRRSPNAEGWLESRATGIELRSEAADNLLAIRLAGDEAALAPLPEPL